MKILMKTLYIGNERRNAQAVATALRAIGPNVTISWTQSLDHCAKYLAQNRDLAVLVMDAQAHAGKWPSSLRDLRSLQVRPAIVVIVPEGTPPTFNSLVPPPDDYVINGQTFLRDLPTVVTRAVARVRGSQPASTTPSDAEEPQQRVEAAPERTDDPLDLKRTAQADLERKLAEVTAAFQQAQRRHAAAMAAARVAHELAATEQLTEQERQFQVQIALERDKRRTVEEMLSEAASALEEAERRSASALADAAAQAREIERAGQREAELLAQSQSERKKCAALEQEVVNADVNMRETQRRHDAALAKAAEELVEQRASFDRELSRTAVEGDQLRERLINAELALSESQHDHEAASANVARLTQREADVSAKLSGALREIEDTRASAARERAAAESRLELKLAREIDARAILERKLSETQSAAFDAERRFREEAAALRAHAQEREAYFDKRLASEQLEYDNRLAKMQHECERLGQARVAADEDVQRLSADLSDAKRALEDTRREFQTTFDRQSTEHATAVAALAVSIAERDERLNEQAVRHDVALRASERARAELQERLQAALAAARHNIEHVQETLMATIEALEATKHRQEILPTEAEPHESRTKDLQVVQQSGLAALQHNEDAALV
jgi:cell division protein ZapA (FtsZ GTPase activity inhibitor)